MRFTINNETWSVEFIPHNHNMLRKSNGAYALGVCSDDYKTIYIQEHLTSAMTKKVLCHELVHAAMFSYDIFLDEMQEELMADIIATYGEEIITLTNTLFKNLKERTY